MKKSKIPRDSNKKFTLGCNLGLDVYLYKKLAANVCESKSYK